ncbi:PREDICTED: protein lethal(2)essential for life-like [Dufourea novaeangliae]|uniref:Protein lethal(2)essential for life n=1 Tax=Dufourea novaeangliae TaxID=178035 RepID=A0A154PDT3_DUFNO|nr:PREDICTED: protein lethal(2)essential for life-like [Dufourea novaeangliae]KZC10001.1 Protein lethal(2)essential for life [Dufourea novaeangliae]
MSLIPTLFSSWWEDLEKPHRLFAQDFGLPLGPEDLPISALVPYDSEMLVLRPRRRGLYRYQPYEKSIDRKSRGSSTVQSDKNKFQVTLDVQQFAPEEVTVKVSGKNVIVEGKHEEKQDEHGWISRHGVLTIIAPRKETDPKSKNERIIQIESTGKPALRNDIDSIEKQKEASPQKNQI